MIIKLYRKYLDLIPSKKRKLYGIEYWENRAKKYGRRSVLNIEHSENEYDQVTKMQKEILLPLLEQQLMGKEKLILDFGCGPGRFTSDLADLIEGKAIGADPIKHLLDLAPKNETVEYVVIENRLVPFDDESFDIIWICLVFGGITDNGELKKTAAELDRVLKKGGLFFLIENTSEKDNLNHWKFRSIEIYQKLMSFATMRHLTDYHDVGERISVMAGRKYA